MIRIVILIVVMLAALVGCAKDRNEGADGEVYYKAPVQSPGDSSADQAAKPAPAKPR